MAQSSKRSTRTDSVTTVGLTGAPDSPGELQRRQQLGSFFRSRRLALNLEQSFVAQEIELDSPEILETYESGTQPMPLECIFSLTNLLNIPPDEVLALVHDLFSHQGHS